MPEHDRVGEVAGRKPVPDHPPVQQVYVPVAEAQVLPARAAVQDGVRPPSTTAAARAKFSRCSSFGVCTGIAVDAARRFADIFMTDDVSRLAGREDQACSQPNCPVPPGFTGNRPQNVPWRGQDTHHLSHPVGAQSG